MADKEETKICTARHTENIRQTLERAIVMSRAGKSDVIVLLNNARFSVSSKTTLKEAFDTYLATLDKIYRAEKQAKQK